MSIQIADTLYDNARAAIRDACQSWLYASGLNDDAYVLATLQSVPHHDIADEVEAWLETASFTPDRADILSELATLQAELEAAS